MTTHLLTVTFNASTGSDTEASGAGPATALHALAGAHTSGSASTTIQLTAGTDLSGVATDGSACLWLKTGSGRQFSRITGKNDGADTVTVEDSFNITLVGAVDWAIGGKRATLDNADSRTLFGSTGAKATWWIQLETDQTLTSALVVAVAGSVSTGLIRLLGGTGGTHYTINQTANAANISGPLSSWHVRGIKFTNSNGTKTAAFGWLFTSGTAGITTFEDCIFGDITNTLASAYSTNSGPEARFINCAAVYCTAGGFGGGSVNAEFTFDHCVAHLNTTFGWSATAAPDRYILTYCIAYANTGDGIAVGTSTVHAIHCTFDGNGSDGWDASADNSPHIILGCQFTNNTGYGINAAAACDLVYRADYNNFSGNTLGARANLTAGAHDTAVDPLYQNRAAGNFAVQAESQLGGGFPPSNRGLGAGVTGSFPFFDIGAVQSPGGFGSGGGAIVRRRHRR